MPSLRGQGYDVLPSYDGGNWNRLGDSDYLDRVPEFIMEAQYVGLAQRCRTRVRDADGFHRRSGFGGDSDLHDRGSGRVAVVMTANRRS